MQSKTKTLAEVSLFSALIVILTFSPLGAIPIGGLTVATITHLPVIIGGMRLGAKHGAFLGAVMGTCSIAWFSMMGGPAAFLFSPLYSSTLAEGNAALAIYYAVSNILICYVPRILIGVVSAALFNALGKKDYSYPIVGVVGSLTNTFFVLGGIALLFREPFEKANSILPGMILKALGLTVITNGVPEAILAGALTLFIGRVIFTSKHQSS